MPKKDTGAPKMRGRAQRTEDGTLREIRDDTLMGTLENRYKVNFNVRSDMEWGTYQKRFSVESIKDAIEKLSKQK